MGGSDARIIMGAEEAALIRLWKEKRGEAEPEDLSDNLVVQLGVATEALNRSWYERNTGRVVIDVQRWVQHPVHRYMAGKLDGFINGLDAVFEATFMLPWLFFAGLFCSIRSALLDHERAKAELRALMPEAADQRSFFLRKIRIPGRSVGVPINSTPAPSRHFWISTRVEARLRGTPSVCSKRMSVRRLTPDRSASI